MDPSQVECLIGNVLDNSKILHSSIVKYAESNPRMNLPLSRSDNPQADPITDNDARITSSDISELKEMDCNTLANNLAKTTVNPAINLVKDSEFIKIIVRKLTEEIIKNDYFSKILQNEIDKQVKVQTRQIKVKLKEAKIEVDNLSQYSH